MRYRVCRVPSNLIRKKSRYWGYYPYYWWSWNYPPYWDNSTNIVGSQIQNADQEMINTGIMSGNTQNQTLTQIRDPQPLK